jgi:MSHA biogenesis protein MshP
MPNQSFDYLQRFPLRRQRGAMLLFAIAILVVASLLGVAMVRMLRVEQVGVATDVISTRALLAADSAAQRAMWQLFVANSNPTTTNCNNTVNNSTINFTAGGLANCTATVTCTPFSAPALSANNYFSIRATGSCGPAVDRATRQVEVLARDI